MSAALKEPPSGYRVEQAMSVAMSLKQRMIEEDPEFAADEALLRDTLEGETDVFDLMRRIARFILDAEAMSKAADERAKKIAERKARFAKRATDARGSLFAMMDALGERRLDDAEFTATINAGRKGTLVTDETAIPDEYWETTRSIKKAAINAAIKDGKVVPGTEQSNAMPTLTIKAS